MTSHPPFVQADIAFPDGASAEAWYQALRDGSIPQPMSDLTGYTAYRESNHVRIKPVVNERSGPEPTAARFFDEARQWRLWSANDAVGIGYVGWAREVLCFQAKLRIASIKQESEILADWRLPSPAIGTEQDWGSRAKVGPGPSDAIAGASTASGVRHHSTHLGRQTHPLMSRQNHPRVLPPPLDDVTNAVQPKIERSPTPLALRDPRSLRGPLRRQAQLEISRHRHQSRVSQLRQRGQQQLHPIAQQEGRKQQMHNGPIWHHCRYCRRLLATLLKVLRDGHEQSHPQERWL